MALEPEDLIANAKHDTSQAIRLLLARAKFYKDSKRSRKWSETNAQISRLRSAIKYLDPEPTEEVLPPIPKRLPHPSEWGSKVLS